MLSGPLAVHDHVQAGRIPHPGELAAPAEAVLVPEVVVGEDLSAHTVPHQAQDARLDRQPVAQRHFPGAFHVDPIAVADGHADVATGLAGRFGGHDVDGSADRILAEQRSLRAAQDFDAFDFQQVQCGSHVATDVHPVNIQADAGVGHHHVVGLSDAAQENAAVLGAAHAVRRERHARRVLPDVAQVAHVRFFQRISRKNGDGNRRLL